MQRISSQNGLWAFRRFLQGGGGPLTPLRNLTRTRARSRAQSAVGAKSQALVIVRLGDLVVVIALDDEMS